MPDFQATITIPAGTARSDPYEKELKVDPGIVIQVYVDIHPGPRGLTGIQIYHGLFQFAPSTQGEYYHGDDRVYSFQAWYPVLQKDNVFTVKAWNLDTEKDHNAIIRLVVLPEVVANPILLLLRVLGPLADYLVPVGE